MAQERRFFSGIRGKLLLSIMALTIIPLTALGVLSYWKSSDTITKQMETDLSATTTVTAVRVQDLFRNWTADIKVLTEVSKTTHAAAIQLKGMEVKQKMDAKGNFNTKSPEWATLSSGLDKYFKTYLDVMEHYDVLIIDATSGQVMYSYAKESDLGQNLSTGQLKSSSIAKVWAKVARTKKVEFTDLEPYEPSGNKPFIFGGGPILDEKGNLVAVVAIQLSNEELNAVRAFDEGLGQSGDLVMIGEDGLYRTRSRKDTDAALKTKSSITDQEKADVAAGKEINEIAKDHNGVECVKVYEPAYLKQTIGTDFDWIVHAKVPLEEISAPVVELRTWTIIFVLITLTIVILITVWLSNSIAKPIIYLSDNMRRLADRDLTINIERSSNDELGDLCDSAQTMVENLREIVKNVTDSAEKVSTSSQELSASAEEMNATTQEVSSTVQQIAKGAESTAQQVEGTSAVMKDVGAAVTQVSARSKEANEVATATNEAASRGGQQVDDAIAKMNKIYDTVNSASDVVKKLGQRSDQINEIVNVITNIADQTNLLALNAAIEAARAGDVGRGFAVVADEVRKLAEGSGRAAEQIAGLIKDIQRETSDAVRSMENGSKEVAEGREVVNRAGQALNEIVRMADNSVGMVQQITIAADQMGVSIKDVNRAVENIASTAEESASATEEASASTEEMTASMEEMAAAAQELSEMAISLREVVGQFKIDDRSTTRDLGTDYNSRPLISGTARRDAGRIVRQPLGHASSAVVRGKIKPPSNQGPTTQEG